MKDRFYYFMFRYPWLALLLVLLALAACATEPPTGPRNPEDGGVASVEVTATVDTLVASGESLALEVTLRDANGAVLTGPTVTWRSSNDAVAGVSGDANGATVNALGAGPAVITAESEGHTATIAMRVLDADVTAVQALMDDDYTHAVLEGLTGANGAAIRTAVAGIRADFTDRFLSGVRDGLAATDGLLVVELTEHDAVLVAVTRLILDHVKTLLRI